MYSTLIWKEVKNLIRKFRVSFEPRPKIWIGDYSTKNSEPTRETGIIGSLRWWYESVIRGLGGYACDPTLTAGKCGADNLCDVCKFFGCTGWARKFRLTVSRNNNEFLMEFIELREILDIELGLLNKTLQIIEKYGSLGGKIAESNYGIIKITENEFRNYKIHYDKLESYLEKNKSNNKEFPAIDNFFFVMKSYAQLSKKLKDKIPSLKGKKGERAKRYFSKSIDNTFNRFFTYAISDDEYIKIKHFFEKENIEFITGMSILEAKK